MNYFKKIEKNKLHIFGFFLLVSCLSYGNLQRITLSNFPAFYVHEIIMLTWMILGFWQVKLFKIIINIVKKYRSIFLATTFLISIGWIIALVNQSAVLFPILYFIRLLFYITFGLFLNELVNKNKLIKVKQLQFGLLFSGFWFLTFGFIQYFFLPDTRFLSTLGWDNHYYRLISTLLDPNFTGILLIISFYLLQTYEGKRNKTKRKKLILSTAFIIGLALTYSRASYLAFLFSLIILVVIKFISKQKIKELLVFGFCFLVLLLLIPKNTTEGTKLSRTASVNARVVSIQEDLQQLHNVELFVGQGLFVNEGPKSSENHAQLSTNSFVQIVMGTGIVGLLGFILFLIKFAWSIYQSKNYELLAALIAIIIHSQFNATLTYPFVIIVFIGFWIVEENLKLKTHN